jgi:hypothetical protein
MIRPILLAALLLGVPCFFVEARDDYDPQAFLRNLVNRSDLVIVATPQTDGGGAMGEGPVPNGVTLTPRFDSFTPQLKVDRVLKGHIEANKLLWITYTVMNVGPKDWPQTSGKSFSFKVSDLAAKEDTGLPGAPHKGSQYIFFLENRKVREPNSYAAVGNEEILYRNFDYWFGMMPASEAMAFEVQELAKLK